MTMTKTIMAIALSFASTLAMADNHPNVHSNLIIDKVGDNCLVSMQINPTVLKMKSNRQMFVTPFIESADGEHTVMLPSVVLSGRNMHYVYLRSGLTKASGKTDYNIAQEMLASGKVKTYSYNETVPLQKWMLHDGVTVRINIDTCGCGRSKGSDSGTPVPANLSPLSRMVVTPFPTPVTEIPKIVYHHGKARVDFEVDKFELHEQVYSYTHKTTKRKHVIDNRAELKVIDDSIRYALSNPNVEIDKIGVCGYASPESPYLHNDYLASNRSRALAEYIAKHYNLPQDRCTYDAVPENWAGFRELAATATTITEQQRKELLELIDRPVYGPSDYDAKEKELATSKKYTALYREQIHPDWFPKLRYTDFVIQTRLKPLTTEQLHDVLSKTPELLSLNQIYTVAADCEHGSEEFHRAMAAALKYYPNDPTANCNAAALAVENKQYEQAAEYLKKAGESDEANVLRGIVEVSRLNTQKAIEYFQKAKNSPEAQRNIQLLK